MDGPLGNYSGNVLELVFLLGDFLSVGENENWSPLVREAVVAGFSCF